MQPNENCKNCGCYINGECRARYPEYVGCPNLDYSIINTPTITELINREL